MSVVIGVKQLCYFCFGIFIFLIEATGAISTNLAQSIICFNAESSILPVRNEWKLGRVSLKSFS